MGAKSLEELTKTREWMVVKQKQAQASYWESHILDFMLGRKFASVMFDYDPSAMCLDVVFEVVHESIFWTITIPKSAFEGIDLSFWEKVVKQATL